MDKTGRRKYMMILLRSPFGPQLFVSIVTNSHHRYDLFFFSRCWVFFCFFYPTRIDKKKIHTMFLFILGLKYLHRRLRNNLDDFKHKYKICLVHMITLNAFFECLYKLSVRFLKL